jgi:hypothetical protein
MRPQGHKVEGARPYHASGQRVGNYYGFRISPGQPILSEGKDSQAPVWIVSDPKSITRDELRRFSGERVEISALLDNCDIGRKG